MHIVHDKGQLHRDESHDGIALSILGISDAVRGAPPAAGVWTTMLVHQLYGGSSIRVAV